MTTLERMTIHPEVVLKNEGSMEQTCQNIKMHVVITDIASYIDINMNVYGLDSMRIYMDSTYQGAQ